MCCGRQRAVAREYRISDCFILIFRSISGIILDIRSGIEASLEPHMFGSSPARDADGVSAETPTRTAVIQWIGGQVGYSLCFGKLMYD